MLELLNVRHATKMISLLGINNSYVYIATTLLALALLIAYSSLIKKREFWILLLYISVFIVNIGYFTLSISKTLQEALLANRFAYLGSVMLPLCMIMTMIEICRLKHQKSYVTILSLISFITFLIAASQGYSDLYYRQVSLVYINGAAKLIKDYGSLHSIYYIYLISYFLMMLGIALYAYFKKSISSKLLFGLLIATFGNVFIWLFEQRIKFDIELLALSYIISEVILLYLYYKGDQVEEETLLILNEKQIDEMIKRLPIMDILTKREKEVLKYLLLNKKRKDIATSLNVTEHTIKKHTANIFDKFHVTSRNELFDYIKDLKS